LWLNRLFWNGERQGGLEASILPGNCSCLLGVVFASDLAGFGGSFASILAKFNCLSNKLINP
jgi:hypothetical protein